MTTHGRTCPLCEALCGLRIEVREGVVTEIRGDDDDPFTRGHVCPKAVALKDLQEDPDRLRTPLVREGTGLREATWAEALDRAADGLTRVHRAHGANAVAAYFGNPSAHNLGMATHASHLMSVLRTRSRFSATSVDQLPHQLTTYLMYGHQLLVPVPDVERTDLFVVVGGNPLASNGSLMSFPDARRRLAELRARGGRLVVVDPRRSETAQIADEYIAIRPGTDAAFLFALIATLFEEGLARPGRLAEFTDGLDEVARITARFTAEATEAFTRVPAAATRRLARALASAPRAAVYARLGACAQRFGLLTQWATQLVNLLTGRLDAEGGSMFPTPAVDLVGGPSSKPGHFGAHRSRVRGLPEWSGELPVAALAEEILTPGDGQIRALVTLAGNPVLSTPDGRNLDRALASLDFMVSIDLFLNETTRHAHVILPTTPPLEHDHFDLFLGGFGIRNYTRYSDAVLPRSDGLLHDWEVLTELGERLAARLDLPTRPRIEPWAVIAAGIAQGPYGARAGGSLTFEAVRAAAHGVDLGPLRPQLPGRLANGVKRIDAAPGLCVADVARLAAAMGAPDTSLLLIGRRHVRSNNSWMHNAPRLVRGSTRHELHAHPDDLAERGLASGQRVRVRSRVGEVVVEVRATDTLMRGVVSLPHGYGHDRPGIRLGVAGERPGVSANDLTDPLDLDVSGTAVLNGVPVEVVSADA